MSRSKKIVHLSSVHPSFDIRIFHKECKTLAQAGYEVVFIVPHDRDENFNGVQIRALRRSRNRFERMTKTTFKIYQMAIRENAQIYHFHDPELIPVGMILKIRGKKVLYDIHEDGPQHIYVKEWIPSFFKPLLALGIKLIEWMGGNFFDGILAATPNIANGFPASKTIVVQNFPIFDDLVQGFSIPYKDRPFNIVYIGVLSKLRGIEGMISAMKLLPEHLGAQLYLAGNFSPSELEYEMRALPGWERVRFLGWQSRGEIAILLNKARIGLVVLLPSRSYLDSYPIKLFEYMSAGIPVIASDFPLWREIIKGADCGLLVDPHNYHMIAEAIQFLLEHPEEAERMGKRGQNAISEKYNWDNEAKKLLGLYQKLME